MDYQDELINKVSAFYKDLKNNLEDERTDKNEILNKIDEHRAKNSNDGLIIPPFLGYYHTPTSTGRRNGIVATIPEEIIINEIYSDKPSKQLDKETTDDIKGIIKENNERINVIIEQLPVSKPIEFGGRKRRKRYTKKYMKKNKYNKRNNKKSKKRTKKN